MHFNVWRCENVDENYGSAIAEDRIEITFEPLRSLQTVVFPVTSYLALIFLQVENALRSENCGAVLKPARLRIIKF